MSRWESRPIDKVRVVRNPLVCVEYYARSGLEVMRRLHSAGRLCDLDPECVWDDHPTWWWLEGRPHDDPSQDVVQIGKSEIELIRCNPIQCPWSGRHFELFWPEFLCLSDPDHSSKVQLHNLTQTKKNYVNRSDKCVTIIIVCTKHTFWTYKNMWNRCWCIY